MAGATHYLLFIDTDEPITITIDALIAAWAERFPLDIARIQALSIGERLALHRIAPYVAVQRVGVEVPDVCAMRTPRRPLFGHT
jgi:hypothetical protein